MHVAGIATVCKSAEIYNKKRQQEGRRVQDEERR
jgi:hypothetical protein